MKPLPPGELNPSKDYPVEKLRGSSIFKRIRCFILDHKPIQGFKKMHVVRGGKTYDVEACKHCGILYVIAKKQVKK